MKSFFITCFLLTSVVVYSQTTDVLSAKLKSFGNQNVFLSKDDFKPFPQYADSSQWDALPKDVKTALIKKGETYLSFRWNHISPLTYLEFAKTGNRSNCQDKYGENRQALSSMVMAEMAEHRGRFMNTIAEGIWAIADESTWVIPAHADGKLHWGEKDFYVDLFAAETSSLFAWTYYLLKDQLAKISPQIPERMYYECNRRIFEPAMKHDEFWWMGIKNPNVNNWNPWITSNWLTSILLMEADSVKRQQSITKILSCIDRYINCQPADGGCEEGAVYWTVAGGRVFQSLDLLNLASKGKFNVYENQKLENILNFFSNGHIGANYFINIGDGPSKIDNRAFGVFHLGKMTGNEAVMSAAKSAVLAGDNADIKELTTYKWGDIYNNLNIAFDFDSFKNYKLRTSSNKNIWLPDLQLWSKSIQVKDRAFQFAMLGAHNGQSHNHNDVGTFWLYVNDQPVLVDVGVETYDAKTFSGERYTIWTMQSAYHNLPTINGMMQKEGKKFKASDVVYSKDALSMNIASAYPVEANVNSWIRKATADKSGVSINEKYDLKTINGETVLNYMTICDVAESNGKIELSNKGQKLLTIQYDPATLGFSKESIAVTDPQLRDYWNGIDHICRIQLKVLNKNLKGSINLKFN